MKVTFTCKRDYQCLRKQYCYDSMCVNFTECKYLNREEAVTPAREGSQCGQCLNGFHASTYNKDTFEVFCKKIPISEIHTGFNYNMMLLLILLALLFFALIMCAYYYIKRQRICSIISFMTSCSEVNEQEGKQKIAFYQKNECKPTAPSEEHDECSELVERKEEFCQPIYNNGVVNDKLQNAAPFQAPNWVANATFGNDTYNNNDTQISIRSNIVPQICHLPVVRDNHDTNEQLAILMPEQTIEQVDNERNIAVITPSSSNDNTNHTNFTFNNMNNDNGNETDGTEIKTVVIKQNITMNWNVTK